MGAPPFEAWIRRRQDGPTIVVRGEVDTLSGPLMSKVFDGLPFYPRGRVVIDLTEVGFMDSTGLRCLLEGFNRLKYDGRDVTFVEPSDAVMRLIRVTGLEEILPFEARTSAPG